MITRSLTPIELDILRKVRDRLQEMQTYPETIMPNHGICTNVENVDVFNVFDVFSSIAPDLYSTWNHWSESNTYPVPDPDFPPGGLYFKATVREKAKEKYLTFDSMWTGRYGDLRWDLLAHLIAELNSILEGA